MKENNKFTLQQYTRRCNFAKTKESMLDDIQISCYQSLSSSSLLENKTSFLYAIAVWCGAIFFISIQHSSINQSSSFFILFHFINNRAR